MMLLLGFLFALATVATGQIRSLPSYEIEALYDLYNATGGSYWKWASYDDPSMIWNFNQENVNPCADRWQGITCMNSTMDENT